MKKTLLITSMLLMGVSFGQVGIDTNTPQRQLHVSGTPSPVDGNGVVDPTIRVDGLNAVNNPAFTSGADILPVYVNSDGDLMLLNASVSAGYGYKVGSNAVDDDLNGSVVGVYDNTGTSVNTLGTYDFNLPTNSLVHFNKSVSLNIAYNASQPLADGKPRMVVVQYRITAAPDDAYVGKRIAVDGASYTSRDLTSASGFFWLNGAESIILPAGDYTVVLEGRMSANPSQTNQEFMCQFGGATPDEVSIIAEPWLY